MNCMDGDWTWTDDDDVTTVISEITCSLGTREPSCGSCTPLLVAFTLPAFYRDLGVGSDGCAVVTVVCPRVPFITVRLRFNALVEGPSASNSEVTATLNCQDDAWVYTSGGTTTTVTAVSCSNI